jgi:hypothetical protein
MAGLIVTAVARLRVFVTTFVPSDFRGAEEPSLFFMS